KTITLTSALPLISPGGPFGNDLTITGPGAGLLTVRRDSAAPNFGVFNSEAQNLTMTGMTVTGGKAGGGGGIRVLYGILNLDGMAVVNNESTGSGGGIYTGTGQGAAQINISNSMVSGNTAATNGGGIYFFFGGCL